MIGASTVVSCVSSRWETSSNVRSRTSSITAYNSATTDFKIPVPSRRPVKRYGGLRSPDDLNQTRADPISSVARAGRDIEVAAPDGRDVVRHRLPPQGRSGGGEMAP